MVEYRVMTIEDYDEVLALWQKTEHLKLRITDSRENISKYLKASPHCSFVAVENGVIVGSVLGGTDYHRSFINHLCVDASMRKKGIGGKLVELCENALSELSDARIYITVRKDNDAGINWWHAHDYEDLDHVTLMWKNIHADTDN